MVIHPDLIPSMEVCPDCKDVVGLFHRLSSCRHHESPLVQRGTCPLHKPGRLDPQWSGFDYNRQVDLCRCCGRTPLQSGSRWSVWFCDGCKKQVGLLNGRHARCIVPIGRHSVHYGGLLPAAAVDEPGAVQRFIDVAKAANQVMTVLRDWQQIAITRNLDSIDADRWEPLPIAYYCRSVAFRVDPMDRFREMCAYLDRRGRAMLAKTTEVDG